MLAERRCWLSCCCWLLAVVDFSSLAGVPAVVNAPADSSEPVVAVVSVLAVVPASQTFLTIKLSDFNYRAGNFFCYRNIEKNSRTIVYWTKEPNYWTIDYF